MDQRVDVPSAPGQIEAAARGHRLDQVTRHRSEAGLAGSLQGLKSLEPRTGMLPRGPMSFDGPSEDL